MAEIELSKKVSIEKLSYKCYNTVVSYQHFKEITWLFNGLSNSSVKNYHLCHVIRHDLR